jgi:sugar lactone lactonase YvrE
MPSPVSIPTCRAGRRLSVALIALAAGLSALAGLIAAGCATDRAALEARRADPFYPPSPQRPRVVALGSLRDRAVPTATQVELAVFLFGAEPPPPLTLLGPTGLASHGGEVLVCDAVLGQVLRWEGAAALHGLPGGEALDHPSALDIAPDGTRLVCHRGGVVRLDASGRVVQTYRRPDGMLRPGGVLAVDDAVWVTDPTRHTVEVFDGATGAWRRTVGAHGHGPGEFVMPRGMARTPAGEVCVVDTLNNRVQVFTAAGQWVRQIGQAGDTVGCFGRPRSVAIGPDGVVFVTDAFSQRVQVFDEQGTPLLAFGEPGPGVGALVLPHGIAITTERPPTERTLPADVTPAYYVLVAEQLDRPGIRVYGWLGDVEAEARHALPSGVALTWQAQFPGSQAINPHWDATRCDTCHARDGARLLPIEPLRIDALCLKCHDGVQAPADPHPIGRPAQTETVVTPMDWPAPGGMIGCITCHDIVEHCDPAAQRPAVNAVLLRGFDPQRPLDYCTSCHRPDVGGRFSPHRQRDATGRVREDACLFCHTQRPEVPADGRRRFEPHLRVESSQLCLNCHSPHWDLSPRGHVDRPVSPKVREWMLMRELAREHDVSPAELARMAAEPGRSPARLPLGGDMVTCYTCHNPHYTGLFPPDTELGALAENEPERISALRTNWIDLCSECHFR